jgi:excisionase family DNA binding protein
MEVFMRREDDGDRLLSVPEVAKLRGVSRVAVQYAVTRGAIPAIRIGRFWAIRKADAEAWVPREYVRSNASGAYPRVPRPRP